MFPYRALVSACQALPFPRHCLRAKHQEVCRGLAPSVARVSHTSHKPTKVPTRVNFPCFQPLKLKDCPRNVPRRCPRKCPRECQVASFHIVLFLAQDTGHEFCFIAAKKQVKTPTRSKPGLSCPRHRKVRYSFVRGCTVLSHVVHVSSSNYGRILPRPKKRHNSMCKDIIVNYGIFILVFMGFSSLSYELWDFLPSIFMGFSSLTYGELSK